MELFRNILEVDGLVRIGCLGKGFRTVHVEAPVVAPYSSLSVPYSVRKGIGIRAGS